MEFVLNLAWVMLAVLMTWQWVKHARGTNASWRVQIVALAVVLVILLPAISMTDDLMAANNPAEIDTCLRRDHDPVSPHAIVPVVAAFVAPFFAGLSFSTIGQFAAADSLAPVLENPALVPIENRPPPAA